MAPFYRVFTNTLGTGPWFDTWISNLPPGPPRGVVSDAGRAQHQPRLSPCSCWSLRRRRSLACSARRRPEDVYRRLPADDLALQGLDVKILGVASARSTTLTPSGTKVIVKFHYDGKYKVPADAKAAVISPRRSSATGSSSSPRRTPGAGDADGADARCRPDRHPARARPDLRLDQRPDHGSRARRRQQARRVRHRALTRLLDSTARNFGGQGVQFNQTLHNLSQLTRPWRTTRTSCSAPLRGRELHEHPGEERRHGTAVQRLAGQRRRAARRRARGPRRGPEEPLGGDDPGQAVRRGEQDPLSRTSRA